MVKNLGALLFSLLFPTVNSSCAKFAAKISIASVELVSHQGIASAHTSMSHPSLRFIARPLNASQTVSIDGSFVLKRSSRLQREWMNRFAWKWTEADTYVRSPSLRERFRSRRRVKESMGYFRGRSFLMGLVLTCLRLPSHFDFFFV